MPKKYIETKQLCQKYGVSNVTVAKWLEATLNGQTGLTFEEVGKRTKILDTVENWAKLDKLGDKAIEKRKQIFATETVVSEEFFQHFSQEETIEIIRDLENKNMINYKFTYKGEGAGYWDNFYKENDQNGSYKAPSWTMEVLDNYYPLIVEKMQDFDEINVVEIGPGNGLPVVDFLKKLKTKIPLKRYIGLDISQELIGKTIENLKKELPSLEYIGLQKDIEKDRIDNAFSYGYLTDKKVANIVLILGGIISNTYDTEGILQNIQKSVGADDIILFNGNSDNIENNVNFSYFHSPESLVQDTWIPKLLGIEIDKMEIVTEYDAITRQKVEYIILDQDYQIHFKYDNFDKKVFLKKGSKLYLWFSFIINLDNAKKLFDQTGFRLVDAVTLPKNEHFMIVTQLRSGRKSSPV